MDAQMLQSKVHQLEGKQAMLQEHVQSGMTVTSMLQSSNEKIQTTAWTTYQDIRAARKAAYQVHLAKTYCKAATDQDMNTSA